MSVLRPFSLAHPSSSTPNPVVLVLSHRGHSSYYSFAHRRVVCFLRRVLTLMFSDGDKYMDRIIAGEAKLREQASRIDALHAKVRSFKFPMQELKFQYGQNKGKSYTEDEDRFLVVRMHHHGIDRDDCYELIKRDIGEWPLFR